MTPEKRNHTYTSLHLEYCTSKRQEEFLDLVLSGITIQEIAAKMGIDPRNALALGSRIRKNASRYGYNADAPVIGLLATPGQELPVKGVSTYYREDQDGVVRPKAGWVKTDRKTEELIAEAKEIILAMSSDIPKAEPVCLETPAASGEYAQLMNAHVLTDYHLGMLAWSDECGANWDTDIAEEFLMKVMRTAVRQAPPARVGLLLQLGDFLHFDGLLPVTPQSGNVLDADSRFAKIVRVAIRCLRRIIAMMLKKYPEVRVVMADANHDPSAGVWLREMFSNFYENEPRVHVDTSPATYGAVQHGTTMVAWHHGHKKRIKDLDKVIAGTFPKMFGATKYRYVHTGHLHHKELMESSLMISEMHSTIAAHDAYAVSGGYISQRSCEVITYHEKYGEVGRQRLTPELVSE